MTYPLYGFTGATSPDQTVNAGLQQYITQGQQGINPGQVQVAASNPVSSAGQMNLAKAFQMSQQPQQVDPAQAALTNGAAMQPNMGDQNMGGVGPTVNNAQAMQAYNGLTTQPQSYADKLAAFLQGGS